MKEQDFLKHYIQNARHLMWLLGAGTSRSAGLPTATDIIWDLKVKYYCAQENQDVKAHDINNKAIRAKIQAFLDSRKSPALASSEGLDAVVRPVAVGSLPGLRSRLPVPMFVIQETIWRS